MQRDRLFLATTSRTSDFEFDEEVAEVFDDMLLRSIPLYLEQQHMVQETARRFWSPGTGIFDLGCSTGTTLANLARALPDAGRLTGYDSSEPMLGRARARLREAGFEDRVELRRTDLNGDLAELGLENASVVTLCWTLQFIRPLRRQALIRCIHEGLVHGGALIVTEKALTASSHMNRFFVELYYDFKRRNGYSDEEIVRKREALENVLVPYRIDENVDLFRSSGFEIVETFFQWYNFVGFLCVKGS